MAVPIVSDIYLVYVTFVSLWVAHRHYEVSQDFHIVVNGGSAAMGDTRGGDLL